MVQWKVPQTPLHDFKLSRNEDRHRSDSDEFGEVMEGCPAVQVGVGRMREREREREMSRRDVSQSVVVRRYQKRALKSSLQVMKPGLVGEWTMQRTMLL